jgi:hypothetical protein
VDVRFFSGRPDLKLWETPSPSMCDATPSRCPSGEHVTDVRKTRVCYVGIVVNSSDLYHVSIDSVNCIFLASGGRAIAGFLPFGNCLLSALFAVLQTWASHQGDGSG